MREATRHKTRKNARGHHRTSPIIIRHHQTSSDIIGYERVVACRMARRGVQRRGWVVACGIVRRRSRRQGWSSRAISLGAGSRALWPVAGSRLVAHPCAFRRPRCPWHGHGRASRTPVVCHAPAQQRAGADAATGGVRTCILFHGCTALWWLIRWRG